MTGCPDRQVGSDASLTYGPRCGTQEEGQKEAATRARARSGCAAASTHSAAAGDPSAAARAPGAIARRAANRFRSACIRGLHHIAEFLVSLACGSGMKRVNENANESCSHNKVCPTRANPATLLALRPMLSGLLGVGSGRLDSHLHHHFDWRRQLDAGMRRRSEQPPGGSAVQPKGDARHPPDMARPVASQNNQPMRRRPDRNGRDEGRSRSALRPSHRAIHHSLVDNESYSHFQAQSTLRPGEAPAVRTAALPWRHKRRRTPARPPPSRSTAG